MLLTLDATKGLAAGLPDTVPGVLIRETGPDGWLRVSIGTSEEMAAFRSALVSALEGVSR